MGASKLPPEVIRVIETTRGTWSTHAADGAEKLGIDWEDIEEIARTAETWKRTRDKNRQARYVEAVEGRDLGGRRLYMAGKVRKREGEEAQYWHVVTVHLPRR